MVIRTLSKKIILLTLVSLLSACGNTNINTDIETKSNHKDESAPSFSYLKPVRDTSVRGAKNNAPTALNDIVYGLEDEVLTGINVLANDVDINGDILTLVRFSQGIQGGTISKGLDGSLTYQPLANFAGTDQFTYVVSDGRAESSAVVTVQIENVNDLLVYGENYTLKSGTVLENMDLLANDVDVDGDLLSISSYTQGIYGGLVEQTSNGLFRYSPVSNFSGVDEFSYTVIDNNGGEATATVTVLVELQIELNVFGESFSVNEDTSLKGLDLLANDSTNGGQLSLVSLTQGSQGGQVIINANGLVDYTPVANFHGIDSFSYTVKNDLNMQRSETVTVNVISVNDVPFANPDTSVLNQGSVTKIDLLSNDSGLGDGVSLELMSLPLHGSVSVSVLGIATYTPEVNYSGTDGFSYRLVDVDGDASITTVSLTIQCINNCGINYLLNWNHSTSAEVTGYKLYVGSSSHNYTEIIELGYITEHIYAGDTDKIYYFAISAVNSSGVESELSPEISTTGVGREQIQPVSVSASSFEIGNDPQSSIDNNLLTRWAANGIGEWIQFDLGSQVVVEEIQLAWYNGNQRVYYFEILTSTDSVTWTTVYSGQSNGISLNLETFDVSDSDARYVRVVGNGNTSVNSNWNSLTEVAIYGTGY